VASNGLHTNGYTLARKIVFEVMGLGPDDPFPGEGESAGEVLLRIHRSYLPAFRDLLGGGALRGLAHITGGGLPGNLPRILPSGLGAVVDRGSWEVPNLFSVLARAGGVDLEEAFRVFNMGVGMVAVVAAEEADSVLQSLTGAGERAWVMGEIEEGSGVRFV
jgi:phosphoribosylformylglycinamidine cyclo-ligase